MITDTLLLETMRVIYPADSLFAGDPFTVDSLCDNATTIAETVYGAASVPVPPPDTINTVVKYFSPLTDNVFYDLTILVCFVSFCLLVYFYRDYALGIFSVMRGGATTDKILGEQSKVFGAFLVSVISLGLFITGLCVLKFTDLFLWIYIDRLPDWWAILPIFLACGTIAVIWGYQFVLLKIAGSLTLSREFVGRLFYLKKIVAAIGTITTLPVFLLFALSDGLSTRLLAILIAGITILLTIFLIIRTFMLFSRHNFSILLWILYFCAVEIFPVSIAVIMTMKAIG